MRLSPALFVVLFLLGSSYSTLGQQSLSWDQVAENTAWQPRDSQGELVYDNQLWIFGGWFNSYEAPPRDVWNSADGKHWNLVQKSAPWLHSDLSMSLTFKNQMWLMGGWYNGRLSGHSASNQVWSSTDGVNWKQTTDNAGWSPRLAAGLVEFKERMWIVGGTENYYFGDHNSLKNDVWSSPDGKTWTQATGNADWAPRAYHAILAFDNKLWIFGGGNYVPEYQQHNDVWSSADGIHWTQVTDSAPWAPRLWFSAAVYRDHMWILGGWQKQADNLGDVWYSRDGMHWTELKTANCWKPRHEHSAFVFQDKLWIAGGHARPLSNEVWSLDLPQDWGKKP
ncbi:MAG: galactose oxidase [Planctomycetales bacterium]|nr:galactose oxidase [Planctomycetales bacterium]